jgi:putative manganese efflux pump
MIGEASFVLSLGGAATGATLGTRLGKRLEIVGGLTLTALDAKTSSNARGAMEDERPTRCAAGSAGPVIHHGG